MRTETSKDSARACAYKRPSVWSQSRIDRRRLDCIVVSVAQKADSTCQESSDAEFGGALNSVVFGADTARFLADVSGHAHRMENVTWERGSPRCAMESAARPKPIPGCARDRGGRETASSSTEAGRRDICGRSFARN